MTRAAAVAFPPQAPAPTGAPPGGAAVEILGLSKRFSERKTWGEMVRHPLRRTMQTALDSVTLTVEPGEFFGLLGPNGAGKTTLFKTLAGLVLPDEGSATVGGLDVERNRSAVGQILTPVIPDERSLYWRLSARENLRLFAALQKLGKAEGERRTDELLEAVGLHETGHKMAGQFSSGMKQRLLIARALLARPRVLLLDEPTRSLDPLSAKAFRRFLKEEVAGTQQCTILLATHIAEEALDLCDRLAVLHRGSLRAVGTVDELRSQVGDDLYRALVRAEGGRSTEAALAAGGFDGPIKEGPEDGWWWVDLPVPGDEHAAAGVLTRLAASGVLVSRFERVPMTLADLIERIVGAEIEPGGTPRA